MSDDEKWRGCSMEEIYRYLNEFELKHTHSVHPSENHTVLYHLPLDLNQIPKPQKGCHKWDAFHVRLPCSSKSQYPVEKEGGTSIIEPRWEMIEKALLRPIKTSKELEAAIISYNSKYSSLWEFRALHTFFHEMDEDESSFFFNDLLPKIIRLALSLPDLIQTAIPLLKQGQNKSLSLSQQQAACLLANAFLCTFPRRNTMKRKSEYSTFPDINFNRLFQHTGQSVIEKIKCILHYFKRVCNRCPTGSLTFTRRSIPLADLPKWKECLAPVGITPLHITSIGTIEDQGAGLLQVDFANKFLGGGVLGTGCVQEEIRFVINPELIISKLFTESLKGNEALLMVGSEQFSKYKGYASTFEWDGNFEDYVPFDESNRRQCHIVAIDALSFHQSSHQYREELMLRELNKAYVGFFHVLDSPAPGVASGNWGCGAFGGDATLKALIQLMACTVNKRPLVYYTFGNEELRNEIHKIHTFFIEENVTVRDLWSYLIFFGKHKFKADNLYDFIKKQHSLVNTTTSTSSYRPHLSHMKNLNLENKMDVQSTIESDKSVDDFPVIKWESNSEETNPHHDTIESDKSGDEFPVIEWESDPEETKPNHKSNENLMKTQQSNSNKGIENSNRTHFVAEVSKDLASSSNPVVSNVTAKAESNSNSIKKRQLTLHEQLDLYYYGYQTKKTK